MRVEPFEPKSSTSAPCLPSYFAFWQCWCAKAQHHKTASFPRLKSYINHLVKGQICLNIEASLEIGKFWEMKQGEAVGEFCNRLLFLSFSSRSRWSTLKPVCFLVYPGALVLESCMETKIGIEHGHLVKLSFSLSDEFHYHLMISN